MKKILAVLTPLIVAASVHAQTNGQSWTNLNYSTGATNVPNSTNTPVFNGYFNNADGWSAGVNNSLWQGQKGWTGTGSGADSISVITDVTPTNALNNNASGTLGLFINSLPLNTANPYLERAFYPGSGWITLTNQVVSFIAEWNVIEAFPGASLFDDTFTFDLRNAANTASLLTVVMNNQNLSPGSGFDYSVSTLGSTNVVQFEGDYGGVGGGIYRMQIDISGSSYTGSYSLLNGATRANLGSFSLNPGSLATGSALDFGVIRLGWSLESGDPSAPGDLAIAVNEFTVTTSGTVVPEPGTWAAGALLALAAGYSVHRRRKAAAVTC